MKLSNLRNESYGLEFDLTIDGQTTTYCTDSTYTGLFRSNFERGIPDTQILGHMQLDLRGTNARQKVIQWIVQPMAAYRDFLDAERREDSIAAAVEFWRYNGHGADLTDRY